MRARHRDDVVFDEPQATCEGWLKFNRHYWQQDWPDFLAFFMGRCFTEQLGVLTRRASGWRPDVVAIVTSISGA